MSEQYKENVIGLIHRLGLNSRFWCPWVSSLISFNTDQLYLQNGRNTSWLDYWKDEMKWWIHITQYSIWNYNRHLINVILIIIITIISLIISIPFLLITRCVISAQTVEFLHFLLRTAWGGPGANHHSLTASFFMGRLAMVEEGKQGKVHEQWYEHNPRVSEAFFHSSLADCYTSSKSLPRYQGCDKYPSAKNMNISGPKHNWYTICNLGNKLILNCKISLTNLTKFWFFWNAKFQKGSSLSVFFLFIWWTFSAYSISA